MKTLLGCMVVSLLLHGCAGNQGTAPEDMSLAKHQAAAEREERAAAAIEARQDAARRAETGDCDPTQGGCWTSRVERSSEYASQVQRHRELAAKHRAASSALARAEAEACQGLSDADRDMSPFAHREDIRSVVPLEEPQRIGRQTLGRTVGARVIFRAVPGMTAEWLQRLVNCHLARAAASGYEMPGMEYCPLMLEGVTATVFSVGDGFAVDIRSDDPQTQEAILQRARALAPQREE